MVTMIAVPDSVPREVFSTTEERIWSWLEDEPARRYPPDTVAPFVGAKPKGMYGGIIVEEQYNRGPTKYLAVERSGVLEAATLDKAAWIHNKQLVYHSAAIIGLTWQFLGFSCDFYRAFARDVNFSFILNLRGTAGAMLGGFSPGWREPYDSLSIAEPCVESGLQFVRDSLRPEMTQDQIAALVRDLATELGNPWGHREARCYSHPQQDPQRPFATQVFRNFVYR